MWPLIVSFGTLLPSVDSASIAGVESRSLIIALAAPLADEMSGTKVKMLLACIEENTVLTKAMKNDCVDNSSRETSVTPYQTTRAVTQKLVP